MTTRSIVLVMALAAAAVASGCGGGGGSSLYSGTGSGTGSGGSSGGGGSTAGGGISQVSSGVPTQRSMSMSAEKYALNWSVDGDTTSITVRVTDTAGNPVPNGTPVQFSTEGGQIQTSCSLTGVTQGTATISACSVTFATQNLRPLDGLITVLVWLEGQEAFIDLNGNGSYDAGEPFYDTGRIFRDDNTNGIYDSGIDELNVGGTVGSSPGLGTSVCGANSGTSGGTYDAASFGFLAATGTIPYSAGDTCDGQWGRTLVRARVVLPVSDPRALGITATATGEVEVFSDYALAIGQPSSPTSAPAGTTVALVGTAQTGCTITVTPPTVPNTSVLPTRHRVIPSGTACPSTVTIKASFGGFEVSTSVPI